LPLQRSNTKSKFGAAKTLEGRSGGSDEGQAREYFVRDVGCDELLQQHRSSSSDVELFVVLDIE